MNKALKPYIAAITAILSWATVATAFKMALAQMSWFSLLTVSVTTAALFLLVIALFSKKLPLILEFSKREICNSVFIGIINPLIYYTILFIAYDLLPAQLALPLNYTWPIMFLIIFSINRRQMPKLFQILGMVLSFSGILFVSSYGGGGSSVSISLIGIVLALFSAVVWATHWMLNVNSKTDGVLSLLMGFGVSAVVLNIIAIIINENPYGAGLEYAVYSGLFEMGIPFVCWQYALRNSEKKSLINQMSYLAPVLSLVLINFYLGEELKHTTVIGAGLIIAGIMVSSRNNKK